MSDMILTVKAGEVTRKDTFYWRNIDHQIIRVERLKTYHVRIQFFENMIPKCDQPLWIEEIDNTVQTFPDRIISDIIVSFLSQSSDPPLKEKTFNCSELVKIKRNNWKLESKQET
jgi:hypothetical protein